MPNVAVGADTQVSTSWSSLSQGHQAESTPAKPDNQQPNDPHQCQVVQMENTSSTNSFQEDDHQSSTAGWFSGAAGQLAASRESAAAVDEPVDSPSRQHEHSSELHMLFLCFAMTSLGCITAAKALYSSPKQQRVAPGDCHLEAPPACHSWVSAVIAALAYLAHCVQLAAPAAS